ncbi:hypothetical protein [Rhizobium leguminosarum]|uniref:hypothetical protein n=1 Tax=Rhizobium leguminosarum TaxID=384 RepID=UPI0014427BC9|nr:hypothetical protein [Rhizobium leguminosarum]NKK43484.1 hypothetical protein [Rhizobium leguminosarum bv. viciae]
MNADRSYKPGGDAQVIARIAKEYYGSYRNMFEVHGWPERGEKMMTSQQSHVVQVYGSVRAFEDLHHRTTNLMFPMEAIYAAPPNVWLTSFYGFGPWNWGFLGFTQETARRGFIENSAPGALVVIYGANKAADDERYNVIGILQCSHETGHAQQFMSPAEWLKKETNPDSKGKWNYAVKVERAWRVTPETRMSVRDFAPDATANEAWQHIGARGEKINRKEADNILKLDLQEVDVYGQTPLLHASPGSAREILAPSRAGPVSQSAYSVRESEGPKHLYILRLSGDANAFLGEPANGHLIVKAGFSRSPKSRCDSLNSAFPNLAFKWEVFHSGVEHGLDAYPTSAHALAGEKAMQNVLCEAPHARSLGGEFFLADPIQINKAWEAGNKTAGEFKQ